MLPRRFVCLLVETLLKAFSCLEKFLGRELACSQKLDACLFVQIRDWVQLKRTGAVGPFSKLAQIWGKKVNILK